MSETNTTKTIPKEQARAGQTSGHVRVILIVSTALAIVCLAIVVISFAGGA